MKFDIEKAENGFIVNIFPQDFCSPERYVFTSLPGVLNQVEKMLTEKFKPEEELGGPRF